MHNIRLKKKKPVFEIGIHIVYLWVTIVNRFKSQLMKMFTKWIFGSKCCSFSTPHCVPVAISDTIKSSTWLPLFANLTKPIFCTTNLQRTLFSLTWFTMGASASWSKLKYCFYGATIHLEFVGAGAGQIMINNAWRKLKRWSSCSRSHFLT